MPPLLTINHILDKIKSKNADTKVILTKSDLSSSKTWFYNEAEGIIQNDKKSFFTISGIIRSGDNPLEQPIIIQNEIGYLGIIRKKINGLLHYLMQYKIEPGNVNAVQISPTIQATKSNFTQKHGGRRPNYLDYFLNSGKYKVIVDQLQSEQSSRFYAKRNRNIIIEIPENEDIDVLSSHDWMTLAQIKELMGYDNLVNMDSRTTLSCLPLSMPYNNDLSEIKSGLKDMSLYNSMFSGTSENYISAIYGYINNYKMFDESATELAPLSSLSNWSWQNKELRCNDPYNFKVVFYDIEIEGREVRHWDQPLIAAEGVALLGLFTCVENDVRLFLVKCISEIGCLDKMEIGPTVQREYIDSDNMTEADKLFDEKLKNADGVMFDTLLSEEGGRFYHEQNRNVIIEIEKNELNLPEGYFWCDYKTLNTLVQVNNVLNIQLRNLISALEF